MVTGEVNFCICVAIPVDDYKEFDDVIAYPLKLKSALNKVVAKVLLSYCCD